MLRHSCDCRRAHLHQNPQRLVLFRQFKIEFENRLAMATSVSPEARGPEIPLQVVPGMPPDTAKPARVRIDSIDPLRGIVMVIMMLDHTRDFVHYVQLQGFDPTDLSHSSTKIFFTRWVTHFCAPIFVFLAGSGAYLQLSRGKSKAELSRFLLTRGFWL